MEVFFQLGLPNARGAKWVTAYGEGVPHEGLIQDFSGGRGMGNAWLVREESDGSLELIVGQSQRIRARRGDRSGARGARRGGALPEVNVAPADLDKDMTAFAAALARKGGEADVDQFGGGDYQQARNTQGAGRALLFLAHLQRQGRTEFVQKVLPDVLAQAPSPELALDAAVSLVADGRLAQLSHEWIARGEPAAFAKGVEALAAEFPRGWGHRDAALLLADRIRTQAPSPGASEPEAKQAAALFLALKPDDVRQLPQGQNWLLPGSRSRARSGPHGMMDDIEMELLASTLPAATEEPAPDVSVAEAPVAGNDALAKFLAGKRAAASALARLLDDHRLLRVLRTSTQSRSYHYNEPSREELLKRAYAELPRPYELGELAAMLLEPLLPDAVRSNADDAHKSERVLAWLKEIAGLSDEQLAWDYLRRARNTYDNDFHTSLSYLIERGGEQTLGKLQEVFLDSAVWQGGSGDRVLPLLEPFLKRLPGDTAAFQEKLKTVYKSALEDEQREVTSGDSINEEMEKHYASRFSAQLKKLDQVLKPQGLGELLGEIAASSSQEDAGALVHAAMPALSKAPRAEAEAQLFQTAAKTKIPAIRQQLLMMTMQLGSPNRGSRESAGGVPPKVPDDAATREALRTLLDDEAPGEAEEFGDEPERTTADSTAAALVWPRLTPPETAAWTALFLSAPDVAAICLKQHARALVAGQPPPPRPDASKVPEEEVKKLGAELAALSAGEVSAALRAKTPDQQLALAEHFAKLPQWPPTLVAAHFTISEVQSSAGDSMPEFAAEHWKGRRFDEAARAEFTETAEKTARDGRGFVATLSSSGPLRGLKLSIRPNKQTFDSEESAQMGLPALAGKPPLIALAALYLQSGSAGEQMTPLGYGFPIWKDAALTQAWRTENLKTDAAKKPADGEDSDAGPLGGSNSAPAFEKRLKAILDLQPEARAPFRLTWFISIAKKNTEP